MMWFVPTQTTCTQNPHATNLLKAHMTARDKMCYTEVLLCLHQRLRLAVYAAGVYGALADVPGPCVWLPDTHWYSWHTVNHRLPHSRQQIMRPLQEQLQLTNAAWTAGRPSRKWKTQVVGSALLMAAIKRGFLSLTCPHETPQHSSSGYCAQ